MEWQNYTDEQLIEKLQNGQEEIMAYILEKYKGMVRKKARAMFLMGGENEDLIQEGMIGLFKAIQDYRQDKETSFYSFAVLCVTRQIYTAVSASNRQKHRPLNSYISLYSDLLDDSEEGHPLQDILASIHNENPEDIMIAQEGVENIERVFNEKLSSFEKQVLRLYLSGESYADISDKLGRPAKAVDNALQRIRGKIQQERQ